MYLARAFTVRIYQSPVCLTHAKLLLTLLGSLALNQSLHLKHHIRSAFSLVLSPKAAPHHHEHVGYIQPSSLIATIFSQISLHISHSPSLSNTSPLNENHFFKV